MWIHDRFFSRSHHFLTKQRINERRKEIDNQNSEASEYETGRKVWGNWKKNEGRKKRITQEKDKIKFEPKNQFKVMILGTSVNS